MPEVVTVTDAKARLSELVAAVATTQDHVDITRNGQPAVVLISHAELTRCARPLPFSPYIFVTERLPTSAHRLGGELSGPYKGKRAAHLGTYRVVYRMDEAAHTVYVLSIRLRGDVYGVR